MQVGRTFGLYAQCFVLQDLAFNTRLRYDEVFTVPIWNMFQKYTFFRRAHRANLKHVSGWHVFQNGTQHVHHVHSFNKYKKHLLLSAENNSSLD